MKSQVSQPSIPSKNIKIFTVKIINALSVFSLKILLPPHISNQLNCNNTGHNRHLPPSWSLFPSLNSSILSILTVDCLGVVDIVVVVVVDVVVAVVVLLIVVMDTLQAEQIEQLKDIFAHFDMDSDGSLTLLELAALLRSLGLKHIGDQIHLLVANMDSNGNGSIEFQELLDAILPEMNQESLVDQDQLIEVFRSFDRDGNGYITAAELAQSMAKMGHPLSFRELTEMFKEADTDGDGAISFTEFTSVMAKSAADFLELTVS